MLSFQGRALPCRRMVNGPMVLAVRGLRPSCPLPSAALCPLPLADLSADTLFGHRLKSTGTPVAHQDLESNVLLYRSRGCTVLFPRSFAQILNVVMQWRASAFQSGFGPPYANNMACTGFRKGSCNCTLNFKLTRQQPLHL